MYDKLFALSIFWQKKPRKSEVFSTSFRASAQPFIGVAGLGAVPTSRHSQ